MGGVRSQSTIGVAALADVAGTKIKAATCARPRPRGSSGSPGRRGTGLPQSSPRGSSRPFSGAELRSPGGIGGNGVRRGIAQPNQRQVEQLLIQIHVGQEPAVSVAAVDVEAQPYALGGETAPRIQPGFLPVALALPSVPRDLRGVDAD